MERRHVLTFSGFAFALAGDAFLVLAKAPPGSLLFLCGVVSFALTHLCWTAANLRGIDSVRHAFVATAVPLTMFVAVRLVGVIDGLTYGFLLGYALISAADLATAWVSGRRCYLWGVSLLVLSDLLIGARWLQVPEARHLAGPVYVLAMATMLSSLISARSGGMRRLPNPFSVVLTTVGLSGALFMLAMSIWPGGDYNPLMRMLSALGRTEVRLVEYPWSHFLFTFAMVVGAVGIARTAKCVGLSRWGAALNVAGLLTIAAIPENVCELGHNAGCHLAAIGGLLMFVGWVRGRGVSGIATWGWAFALLTPFLSLLVVLVLHALHIVSFAPWVTTAQKLLILAFVLWIVFLVCPYAGKWHKIASFAIAMGFLGLAVFLFGNQPIALPEAVVEDSRILQETPLTDLERRSFAWLEYVTGKLSEDEEREWWTIGGRQYGISSKRYQIAFCGYAATALGLRNGGELRGRAVKVLLACIERYLRNDVWGYSQSRWYWGRKPWAPDPCYRENVMYTGHLLQLLAFYELLSGDDRFWRGGFDFRWKDGRCVHYDVKKLIDVTVRQMRQGPTGGISCEPGLCFFPCNNHPHVALKVFAALGHGDWSSDAARWERWALPRYLRPAFGGGLFNLVYHVRGGFFYPRGQDGLDAWSLLWYEPWASDRRVAVALWRQVASALGWARYDDLRDSSTPDADCRTPNPVSAPTEAIFLAAAARACDDAPTAERLERRIDALYLVVRDGGEVYWNMAPEWRIGASACRILSLALSNGFSLRSMTLAPLRGCETGLAPGDVVGWCVP